MRKASAITRAAFEDLGSLGPVLTQGGFGTEVADAYTPDGRTVDGCGFRHSGQRDRRGMPSSGEDTALHPIFADLRVLHCHGDTSDLSIRAQHVAEATAYPNYSFAIGRYGLGPPEVTMKGLERWYVGHECELGNAKVSVSQLREDSRGFGEGFETAAQCYWWNWLTEALAPNKMEDRT